MTTATTAPGGGGGSTALGAFPHRPPRRPRHRWLAAVVVALLIAIPAGYLALSAYQSRDSGEDKARSASARALIYEWPSKVLRRIYDVPIPSGSAYVGYYETNTWDESTLYVEFRCSPSQLTAFLEELGTDRSQLVEDTVTIDRSSADVIGWRFDDPTRAFAGTVVQQSEQEPEVSVTVDLTREERPRVYVVSTTDP
ncbi:hypothetical protein [Streptomyces sp. NBC_01803]|uniref:hypothetical protein n=1 Tax=Streptomyces sp. NBC_01803 TaxID=2975946 RepID=UPI002DD7EF8F|nr:hypothetical protein [Streptomyces sp. NBC_01803]WSA43723.1 hypothetical protein OIE51_05615 [Streptomyces sp. NBC_01803]